MWSILETRTSLAMMVIFPPSITRRNHKMKQQNRMDARTAPKIFDFSTRGQADEMSRDEEVSWLTRRLHDLGVFEMVTSTRNQPPGFFVNWTTVTSLIAVMSLIGGLFYFCWNTAASINYEKGKAEAQRDQMQKQMDAQANEIRVLNEKLKQAGQ